MKHISHISESAASGRLGCRESTETFEPWIDELSPADRAMMKLYLRGGGFSEIGRVCGTRAENVSRRVRKVTARISAVKFCEQNRQFFSYSQREIAKDYFLHAMTISQIAAITRLPYKKINKMILEIQKNIKTLKNRKLEIKN
ncbi:MAG TPA: hypothetical protein VJB62_03925 [Patescibacteria group bacterium]|nr:hypothetical protein [Patescibacteria group bacterium]